MSLQLREECVSRGRGNVITVDATESQRMVTRVMRASGGLWETEGELFIRSGDGRSGLKTEWQRVSLERVSLDSYFEKINGDV